MRRDRRIAFAEALELLPRKTLSLADSIGAFGLIGLIVFIGKIVTSFQCILWKVAAGSGC
jgi:hypothetical protein